MKIGIISDTHDRLSQIKKAVRVFMSEKIDTLIHAGDFCSPFVFNELEPLKKVCSSMFAVFGNNDGDKIILMKKGEKFCRFSEAMQKIEIGNKKIALMHFPDLAESVYRSGDFDLVIFGHTHVPRLDGNDKKLINPGSCSGYFAERSTIAVADLNTMETKIIYLDQAQG